MCRQHNRAALATTVASVARRRGLDAEADDDQLAQCAEVAKAAPLKAPLSAETLAAIRCALARPLDSSTSAKVVAATVFAAFPTSLCASSRRAGRSSSSWRFPPPSYIS